MRHILTLLIAFHWMAVFALLAIVSTLNPEHGISAALSFFGVAPTPDAYFSGGGPMAAGLFSFAFAVACVLFSWALATALLGKGFPNSDLEQIARIALAAGIGAVSLLLFLAAAFSVLEVIPVCAIAIAALFASHFAVFAGRRGRATPSAEGDLQIAARLMAAGAAHRALLPRNSRRTDPRFCEAAG